MVIAIDASTGRRVSVLKGPSNTAFAELSADDELAILKSTSGELAIFEVGSGRRLTALTGFPGQGPAAHFSMCGRYVVDGSWNGSITIRSADDLSPMARFEFDEEMIVGISHDNSRSNWCLAHDPTTPIGKNFGPPPYLQVWRWPFESNRPGTIALTLDILGCALISPCGSLIACVGYSRERGTNLLQLLSLDGELVSECELPEHDGMGRLHWSKDGNLLVVVDRGQLALLRVSNLAEIAAIKVEKVHDATFFHEHETLIVGYWESTQLMRMDAVNSE